MQVSKLSKSALLSPWTFIVIPWSPFLLFQMLSHFTIPNWAKVVLLLLQLIIPLGAIVYSASLRKPTNHFAFILTA
jgi:hypothetical protein